MKKKVVSILTAAVMMTAMVTGCGSSGGATIETVEETTEAAPTETAEAPQESETAEEAPAESAEETTEAGGDYHIGIVTGSVSQSEDDRRGAEAFQAKYGEDRVILAT
jgi:hypothetical protein